MKKLITALTGATKAIESIKQHGICIINRPKKKQWHKLIINVRKYKKNPITIVTSQYAVVHVI